MTSLRLIASCLVLGLLLMCSAGDARAQTFSVSPTQLSFAYQVGGGTPAAQTIYVSSATPAASFGVTVSGAPWLTVSPISGVVPSTLVASVTGAAGLAPGTYTGSIIIGPVASADALKSVVTVILQVTNPPSTSLTVVPDNLTFDFKVGGPFPPPAAVSISSSGATSFTLTPSTNWIVANASGFTTPATAYISVAPASLVPGVYSGFVTVATPNPSQAPRQIFVTLRITSASNLVASPSAVTFRYQIGSGTPPPQTVNVVNSSGGAVGFTLSSITANGGSWLGFSPSSGTTSTSFITIISPLGLPVGTYYGTINITPLGSTTPSTQVPVTLVVVDNAQLRADPSSLLFEYVAGGPLPPTQYVSINSTGSPISFNVQVFGPSWVSVSMGTGVTPAGLAVYCKPPASTPSGTYAANIVLVPGTAGASQVSIPVTVEVFSANYVTVARTKVAFNATVDGLSPAPVIVPVSSSGGSLRFDAFATAGYGGWLGVRQGGDYTPANVTISVNPAGLTPGTYTGSVVISAEGASNGQQNIEVTLTVSLVPSFQATPFGLVFSHQMNAPVAAPQAFVLNTPNTSVGFTTSVQYVSGTNWLTVVGQGATPMTILASIKPESLGPGTYAARIVVNSNDGVTPALEVPVLLGVSPSPVFAPTANQVSFQWQVGKAVPAAQRVTINLNNGGNAVFYPVTVTADGGSWLTVFPDVAITPGELTLSVNPSGLAPGLYYGVVGITDPGDSIPTGVIPVTLQVSDGPILNVAGQALTFSYPAGSSTVQTQQIGVGNAAQSSAFHVTTSGGDWLRAAPVDGTTYSSVNVSATPAGRTPGYYTGLVTVEIPSVQNSRQMVPVVMAVGQ